jgi:transcriptional regulator with XRE-family HTH domain
LKQKEEIAEFGRIVRRQRNEARLSQEAVATLAFGNGDRKGFVSEIENARRPGLSTATIRKLANSLEIRRDEVPPSLRWPLSENEREECLPEASDQGSTLISQEERIIQLETAVGKWTQEIDERVAISPFDHYIQALEQKLESLTYYLGRPFSFHSFCACLTISYAYLFLGGMLSYSLQGGSIGDLNLIDRPDWAEFIPHWTLATVSTAMVALTAYLANRWAWVRSTDKRTVLSMRLSEIWRIHGFRIFCSGVMIGFSAVVCAAIGVDVIISIMVTALFGFAALSNLHVKSALVAGVCAGAFAGGLESLFDDKNLPDIVEGSLFGAVLCGSAGIVAAAIGKPKSTPLAGSVVGAGIGAATGAAVTSVFFILVEVTSVDLFLNRIISNEYFSVITIQDVGLTTLVLVWFTLPIANSIADYLSYGTSVKLAFWSIASSFPPAIVFLVLLADLILAATLSLVTLAMVLAGLYSADIFFEIPINTKKFALQWWNDPLGSGVWLTVMVISTLLWSVLYYIFVILPAVSKTLFLKRIQSRSQKVIHSKSKSRIISSGALLWSYAPALYFFLIFSCLLIASIIALAYLPALF